MGLSLVLAVLAHGANPVSGVLFVAGAGTLVWLRSWHESFVGRLLLTSAGAAAGATFGYVASFGLWFVLLTGALSAMGVWLLLGPARQP